VQTIIINPHKNWSPPFREGRRATREREEKGRRTHQELKQVIAVFVGEVKEREKRSIAHTRGVSKSKRQNESLKNPFDDDVNDRTTKKVVSFPFNEDRSKKTTQSKKKKKKNERSRTVASFRLFDASRRSRLCVREEEDEDEEGLRERRTIPGSF
tara:strand:- start:139 stop:603 length:465 start_codon:yes stop_codon:yes gene_type:complete